MQDKFETLREEVIIPDIVMLKANDAFHMIRQEEKMNKIRKKTDTPKKSGSVKSQIRIKRIIILAAVLTFALGTVGFAYYVKWSRGLENSLHTTEEIKAQAIETKLADFPEQSVTINGVTVTAKQSIVDSSFAYLAFEVKGYDPPQGAEPGFDGVGVTVDGQSVNMCASFYDGVVAGEDGRPVYEDGTPLQSDENGNTISRYIAEDGTLEYQISLALVYENDTFIGKPVHVVLKDLGIYTGKAMPVAADVEGEWVFDWTLQGSDAIYKTELNEKLEGTDVTVIGVEVSPISLKAIFDAPRVTVTEQGMDENGESFDYETYVEPPSLAGVKMKDGSFYPYLFMGPGRFGYEDENSDIYREMFAIDRILDVSQVEALLFRKDSTGSTEGTAIEDRYYIVNIR